MARLDWPKLAQEAVGPFELLLEKKFCPAHCDSQTLRPNHAASSRKRPSASRERPTSNSISVVPSPSPPRQTGCLGATGFLLFDVTTNPQIVKIAPEVGKRRPG